MNIITAQPNTMVIKIPEAIAVYLPRPSTAMLKIPPHITEVQRPTSKKCKDCGFSYYLNPSSATVALILNSKEELLVVRRKKDPAKGALDLPGGFVDMDETGEEGMAREVKEETGLDATEVKYQFSYPNLYLYSGFMVHTLDMFYEVKVKDDTHIEAMDDAEESFWIPLSKLNPDEFAFDSIRKGLHRYLETKLG